MLAVSMRMTRAHYPGGKEELRDALAHDWWRFFQAALPNTPVLPTPNTGKRIETFLHAFPVAGLVLSGGDDWGVFPQRDMTEELLFHWAVRRSLPVLGVCRGAQVINRLMGGKTRTGFDEKHVRTRHTVQSCQSEAGLRWKKASFEVNSFHSNGIDAQDLASGLYCAARAEEDGSVEAFATPNGRVIGIMWHPEREETPAEHDLYLVRHLFTRKHS